jgi:hypothetical protein
MNAGMNRATPEHEADRQTISRVTSMGGGPSTQGGRDRFLAPEADRATVFAQEGLGRPQPSEEASRGTQLTPERLGELSGGGTVYPGGGGGYQGGGYQGGGYQGSQPGYPTQGVGGPGASFQGTRPDYGQGPTQHPDTRLGGKATEHPNTQQVGGPAWPDAVKARSKKRKPRWRGLVSTLITVIIVAGVAGYWYIKNHHAALKDTGVSVALLSQPRNCAGTVDVVGTITTNGSGGTITYQWTKNSTVLPAATVSAGSGQNSVQVTLKWTFTGKGTQQDVAELQVLSPTPATGNAQFTYTCK